MEQLFAKSRRRIAIWTGLYLCLAFALPTLLSADFAKAMSSKEARQQEWEVTQQKMLRERDVCYEHCGGNRACKDKCDKAYTSRYENEYKRIFQQVGTN